MLVALLCLAATAFAGEVSFYDSVNDWIVRVYTADGAEGLSVFMEILDNEGRPMHLLDVLVNGQTPSALPILICGCGLETSEISVAHKSSGSETEVYVFDTHSDGLHLHNNIRLSSNQPAVNGDCGPSDGQNLTSAPTTGLCDAGTASAVSGTGPWTWNCEGLYGGTTANCSANKRIDGVCGPSNGQTFTSAPTTGLCSAGNATAVSGSGPWTWSCTGLYDGTTAGCSANIASGGTPDLTLPSVSGLGSSYSFGSSINFSVTVRNSGNGPSGPFKVKVYQSGSSIGTWSIDNLDAGASLSGTIPSNPNSSCAIHTYCTFTVKADGDNQVAESSESNNTWSRQSYRAR